MRTGHRKWPYSGHLKSEISTGLWPPTKAAGNDPRRVYARISTQDQRTIPLQMRAMREYATTRGWTICQAGEGSRLLSIRTRIATETDGRGTATSTSFWSGVSTAGAGHLCVSGNDTRGTDHLDAGFASLTQTLDLTTPTGRDMPGKHG
jgi:hypothetical protein